MSLPTVPAVAPSAPQRATRTAMTSDYSELMAQVRGLGLLRRRRGAYAVRSAALGAALLLTLAAVLWLGDSWYQLVVAAVLGVVLSQYGFLAHDAAHRQIFETNRANEWTARLMSTAGHRAELRMVGQEAQRAPPQPEPDRPRPRHRPRWAGVHRGGRPVATPRAAAGSAGTRASCSSRCCCSRASTSTSPGCARCCRRSDLSHRAPRGRSHRACVSWPTWLCCSSSCLRDGPPRSSASRWPLRAVARCRVRAQPQGHAGRPARRQGRLPPPPGPHVPQRPRRPASSTSPWAG